MPIPKPKAGEDRKAFVSRCMSDTVMVGEYPEAGQRAGVCNTTFERSKLKAGEELPEHLKGILPDKVDLKLETKRLEKIEILRTGTWNGRKFTTKEIDEAIKHFNAGLIEPYINIAHDDKITKDMQKILGVFSFGFVDKLWRAGEILLANFKQVPKMVAEWIESGALKQRSVEWWHTFKKGNGEKVANVLECVTFFGANGIPAVNGLSDVMDLYQSVLNKKASDGSEDGERDVIILQEGQNMKVEIEQAELEKLKASAGKTATLETKLSEFEKKAEADKKAEMAKLEKEKDDKIAKLEQDAKDRDAKDAETHKETLKAEGKAFIDKIVLAKKLAPAYQADEIDRYVELKTAVESAEKPEDKKAAEERFARFKKRHEDAGEIANFADLPDPDAEKSGGELDRSLLKDENKMQEAIEGRMKAKGIKWAKAREEILTELGEEA